jgi:hypothetical protein
LWRLFSTEKDEVTGEWRKIRIADFSPNTDEIEGGMSGTCRPNTKGRHRG